MVLRYGMAYILNNGKLPIKVDQNNNAFASPPRHDDTTHLASCWSTETKWLTGVLTPRTLVSNEHARIDA